MGTSAKLDAKVIEEAAAELTRAADLLPWKGATIGALVGAVFGGFPLTPLGDVWPIPSSFGFATLLLGALAGAVVGYVIGEGRSRGIRVRAQTTLTQAYLVRNAAGMQRELQQLAAALSKQAQEQQFAPAAAPQSLPPVQAPMPPVAVPAPQPIQQAPPLQPLPQAVPQALPQALPDPPAQQQQQPPPPTLRPVPAEPPASAPAASPAGPPLSPPVSR